MQHTPLTGKLWIILAMASVGYAGFICTNAAVDCGGHGRCQTNKTLPCICDNGYINDAGVRANTCTRQRCNHVTCARLGKICSNAFGTCIATTPLRRDDDDSDDDVNDNRTTKGIVIANVGVAVVMLSGILCIGFCLYSDRTCQPAQPAQPQNHESDDPSLPPPYRMVRQELCCRNPELVPSLHPEDQPPLYEEITRQGESIV
jgi:hypothetical protein